MHELIPDLFIWLVIVVPFCEWVIESMEEGGALPFAVWLIITIDGRLVWGLGRWVLVTGAGYQRPGSGYGFVQLPCRHRRHILVQPGYVNCLKLEYVVFLVMRPII